MFLEEYSLGVKFIDGDLNQRSSSFLVPCEARNSFIVALMLHGRAVVHFEMPDESDSIQLSVPYCPLVKQSLKKQVVADVDPDDVREVFLKHAPDLLQRSGGKDANRAAELLCEYRQLLENNG